MADSEQQAPAVAPDRNDRIGNLLASASDAVLTTGETRPREHHAIECLVEAMWALRKEVSDAALAILDPEQEPENPYQAAERALADMEPSAIATLVALHPRSAQVLGKWVGLSGFGETVAKLCQSVRHHLLEKAIGYPDAPVALDRAMRLAGTATSAKIAARIQLPQCEDPRSFVQGLAEHALGQLTASERARVLSQAVATEVARRDLLARLAGDPTPGTRNWRRIAFEASFGHSVANATPSEAADQIAMLAQGLLGDGAHDWLIKVALELAPPATPEPPAKLDPGTYSSPDPDMETEVARRAVMAMEDAAIWIESHGPSTNESAKAVAQRLRGAAAALRSVAGLAEPEQAPEPSPAEDLLAQIRVLLSSNERAIRLAEALALIDRTEAQ